MDDKIQKQTKRERTGNGGAVSCDGAQRGNGHNVRGKLHSAVPVYEKRGQSENNRNDGINEKRIPAGISGFTTGVLGVIKP